MAKSAAYHRRKKQLAKARRAAQRAAESTNSADSNNFSEDTIQRQLCYLIPVQFGTYDNYESYLQAQYEDFWWWCAPWYMQSQVQSSPQSQSNSYVTPDTENAKEEKNRDDSLVKEHAADEFDVNRYFGPVPYTHENLKYMTKEWWEGVGGWVDGTHRGGYGGDNWGCGKGGVERDEWGCDFCGVECFC